MVVEAGYDGIQMDWEGLKAPSHEGLETFVHALRLAATGKQAP